MAVHIVAEAYADAELNRPCPNCAASVNSWCTRPDGRVRRVPCIARTLLAAVTPEVGQQA